MSMDVNQEAKDLVEQFDEEYQDEISVEDVEAHIQSFVDFNVTGDEAVQGAVSKITKELDISRNELFGEDGDGDSNGPADFVSISDISEDEQWVSVEAKVTNLWDNDSDAISQVGVLDDGTSSIKFLAWSKSDVPVVNEGQVYEFRNVITREETYKGETRMAVHLNSSSEIEMSDAEVTASTQEQTLTGAFLGLQAGSGLIQRNEDGEVVGKDYEGETEFDLRIRGVLDTGTDVYTVYLDEELTERLTGISLESAREMAREALDREVVADEMEKELVGKYFTVTGNIRGDAIFANDFEEAGDHEYDVGNLLVRARSM